MGDKIEQKTNEFGQSPFNPTAKPTEIVTAPTGLDVASDPGKYYGTNLDPIVDGISRRAACNYSDAAYEGFVGTGLHFYDFFKFARAEALVYFRDKHGAPLNFEKLHEVQRDLLGLRKVVD